jgi:hypothetical protein
VCCPNVVTVKDSQKRKTSCVNALQTKRVSGLPLESACRSACKQFVIMEYSGVCYNERRYNKRMLQWTVFINKIRMLQRTQMLQRTRRNTISRRSTRVRMTCQDGHPKQYERWLLSFHLYVIFLWFLLGKVCLYVHWGRSFMFFMWVRFFVLLLRKVRL